MAGKPPSWKKRQDTVLPAGNFNNKGRVNLRVEDFDRLINQKGVRVKVYRTMFCPNVASIDGVEHDINCQLCHGAQFLSVDPVCTLAFLQTQTETSPQQAEGVIDHDVVYATFERGIELQYFTLVELVDFEDTYFQRIQRQAGQTDKLKYHATCVNVAVDSQGNRYYQGNDFELDANGSVKWKTGKGPSVNSIYSVHYQMKKQFRAIKAQHVERYTQIQRPQGIEMVKLPEQWIMTRDYLVERKDRATGDSLGPDNIFDPVTAED